MDNTIDFQMEWNNYFYLDLLDDTFCFWGGYAGSSWLRAGLLCVAESRGYCPVAVRRLLLALNSLVAEQKL